MGFPVNFSDYIVFVDESGSPTLTTVDPEYPLFVLVLCVVEKSVYADVIQPALKKLKFEFFGHDMTVLHANDIRKPKGEFLFLLHPEQREYFMRRLTEVLTQSPFHLIVYAIHKQRLVQKYAKPFSPYNIALRMCLEQLSLFLKERNQHDRLTHIIAESRGEKEDKELELEFRRILDPNYNWGIAAKFPIHETPLELRFAEKKINSAGLQFADLAGQPIGRHILNPAQSNQAFAAIQSKIWRQVWHFP